jgi:hypothetical protein
MPKPTKPKTKLKVKDLAPRSGAAKDVKGGGIAPCYRNRG